MEQKEKERLSAGYAVILYKSKNFWDYIAWQGKAELQRGE